MKLLNKETPKVAPSLKEIREGRVRVDRRRRAVPAVAARRLRHRAAAEGHEGVRRRHAGAVEHAADLPLQPGCRPDTAACVIQNDQIAKHVRDYPQSFYGIATLPMQAPKAAADELERAMDKLGLKGMQIGSNINGKNLDDPEFEPVWAVANQHSAFMHGASEQRRRRRPAEELLPQQPDRQSARHHDRRGLSGVRRRDRALSQHPLLHGARRRLHAVSGRALAARLARAARAEEPSEEAAGRDHPHASIGTPSCTRKPQLEFLVQEFGAAHVMLGSDYPYDMGTFECARQVKALSCGELDKVTILNGLVQKLLAGVK